MKKLLVVFSFACGIAACGPTQSPECAFMLSCVAAIDAENGTDTASGLEDAYGEGGTCWTNGDSATACNNACNDTNASNADAFPDIADCQDPPAAS